MAQGLKLPLKTVNGRLVQLTGDEYIEQLIVTGLGPGDSDNPFQDVGLGEFMIFDLNDERTEGEIRERIARMFAILEADQLAKLKHPSKSITFYTSGVDKYVSIEYVNMETKERVELDVPLPGSAE